MVYRLTDELIFPDPHYGDPDGLLAVGGDLSIDRLILAYSNGIFPWYAFREGIIQWWCPLDRFVIFPNEIHVSHSMRTLIHKGKYRITINRAFNEVIYHCSRLRIHQNGAWLGPEMTEAYTRLYEQGFAASVEVWDKDDWIECFAILRSLMEKNAGNPYDENAKRKHLGRMKGMLYGDIPVNASIRLYMVKFQSNGL